jgi:hypothetical protein
LPVTKDGSSVADGDTVTVLVDRKQIKVRLVDIDAPESRQPFGTRSEQSLAQLCYGNRAVVDDRGQDRYRRTLAQVTFAGVDANAERCAAVGLGFSSATHPKTRRYILCNKKPEQHGEASGAIRTPFPRGNGDSSGGRPDDEWLTSEKQRRCCPTSVGRGGLVLDAPAATGHCAQLLVP